MKETIKDEKIKIDLSNLNLNLIPHSLLDLPNLTEIDLSNKSISEIPDSLCELDKIVKLNIENNLLQVLNYNLDKIVTKIIDSFFKMDYVYLSKLYFKTIYFINGQDVYTLYYDNIIPNLDYLPKNNFSESTLLFLNKLIEIYSTNKFNELIRLFVTND